MLRQSDIKKPAAAPAPAAPAPAVMGIPASPAPDLAQLGAMQQAMGQLAGTMEKLAWGIAAAKPADPAVAMEADIVRDDQGRMTKVIVTIIR